MPDFSPMRSPSDGLGSGEGRIPPVSLPPAVQRIKILSSGAQKFFNQRDFYEKGSLRGEAVKALAKWVWCSLHQGEEVSSLSLATEEEAMRRSCEMDGDGSIDEDAFTRSVIPCNTVVETLIRTLTLTLSLMGTIRYYEKKLANSVREKEVNGRGEIQDENQDKNQDKNQEVSEARVRRRQTRPQSASSTMRSPLGEGFKAYTWRKYEPTKWNAIKTEMGLRENEVKESPAEIVLRLEKAARRARDEREQAELAAREERRRSRHEALVEDAFSECLSRRVSTSNPRMNPLGVTTEAVEKLSPRGQSLQEDIAFFEQNSARENPYKTQKRPKSAGSLNRGAPPEELSSSPRHVPSSPRHVPSSSPRKSARNPFESIPGDSKFWSFDFETPKESTSKNEKKKILTESQYKLLGRFPSLKDVYEADGYHVPASYTPLVETPRQPTQSVDGSSLDRRRYAQSRATYIPDKVWEAGRSCAPLQQRPQSAGTLYRSRYAAADAPQATTVLF